MHFSCILELYVSGFPNTRLFAGFIGHIGFASSALTKSLRHISSVGGLSLQGGPCTTSSGKKFKEFASTHFVPILLPSGWTVSFALQMLVVCLMSEFLEDFAGYPTLRRLMRSSSARGGDRPETQGHNAFSRSHSSAVRRPIGLVRDLAQLVTVNCRSFSGLDPSQPEKWKSEKSVGMYGILS